MLDPDGENDEHACKRAKDIARMDEFEVALYDVQDMQMQHLDWLRRTAKTHAEREDAAQRLRHVWYDRELLMARVHGRSAEVAA